MVQNLESPGLSGRVDSTVTNRCLITSRTHATLAGPRELFIKFMMEGCLSTTLDTF